MLMNMNVYELIDNFEISEGHLEFDFFSICSIYAGFFSTHVAFKSKALVINGIFLIKRIRNKQYTN